MTVIYPRRPAHTLPGMAATPVTGPAPDPLAADSRYIDPAILAKFDTICSRMGVIAEAVNAFTDPTLRERAFYELVGIINPSPDEPELVDVIALPQTAFDRDFAVRQIGELSVWVIEKAPTAWREAARLDDSTAANVIDMLARGADAWTQILLVKHALMTAAGFSAEQVDGDLVPLIREMAADPPPIAPEVEQLATYLRGQAEPGETVAEAAIRLIERLRSGRPTLVPTPETGEVDQGLRREPDQVDDRDGERAPQPDDITPAIQAYKERTGTS